MHTDSFNLQKMLYQNQNKVQEVFSILNHELHQAGKMGCGRLTNDFPVISYQHYQLTPHNKFVGHKESEFVIRYAAYPNVYLTELMKDNNKIITSEETHYKPGDILIIANCAQAEIFMVKKIIFSQHKQEIIPMQSLHHFYDKYAEVSKLIAQEVYLEKKDNKFILNMRNLYDVHPKKIELMHSIKRLNFFYTLNQNGRLIDVAAEQVKNWENVLGLMIEMEVDLASTTLQIHKKWYTYVALQ